MYYRFLNKDEYRDIYLYRIQDNINGLPFMISYPDICPKNKHRHEYIQIIYVLKGRLKHIINNNQFDIYRGDIFIVPPFIPHSLSDEYGSDYQFVQLEFIPEFIHDKFSSDILDESFMDFAYLEPFLVSENEMKPRLNLTGVLQKEVESLLFEMMKEYETRDIDFTLMVKALLMKLLILLGRAYKKDVASSETQELFERHREAINNAIKYIDDHYTCDVSLDVIAKVAMMSSSYFRYLFKQMTTLTLMEYINKLRISKAIEILKNNPDLKVIDICYQVGYNNLNHFNRNFKRETGLSPVSFKKSVDSTIKK